jgi:predicted alpha/beta-fold hydrolase
MIDFDESYSRRVLGFSSVDDMYKWVSCVKLMHQIKELPMLITNALDDPLIVRKCHEIPEKYTGKAPSDW